MEHAITNASALVPCLCHSFSSSPFCRQQVLSALSHHVPLVPIRLDPEYVYEPWLQFLLATVIYVGFFDAKSISESKDSLCQGLKRFGIGRRSEVPDAPDSAPPRDTTFRVPLSSVTLFPRSHSTCDEDLSWMQLASHSCKAAPPASPWKFHRRYPNGKSSITTIADGRRP